MMRIMYRRSSASIIINLPSTIISAMVVSVVVTGVMTSIIFIIVKGTWNVIRSAITLIIDVTIFVAVVM